MRRILRVTNACVVFWAQLVSCVLSVHAAQAFRAVDFSASMNFINGDGHLHKESPKSQYIHALYTKNLCDDLVMAPEPRIEKIIHQIWLSDTVPAQYLTWQRTIQEKHPGWQYILWDARKIDEFGLTNKYLYARAERNAFKADIARYEILYRLGGIYLDMDVECLQSFEPLCRCCDFFAGCDPDGERIQICILGARKGNKVIQSCIDELAKTAQARTKWSRRWKQTGPDLLTKHFYRTVPGCDDRWVILPASYVFPLPKFARFKKANLQDPKVAGKICPETLAIHYWHTGWVPKASFVPKDSCL